jgi:probable O-glycosylation ligase (exosortase A-associated)
MYFGKEQHLHPICLFFVQASISAIFSFRNNLLNSIIYDNIIKILILTILMSLLTFIIYRIHDFIIMCCLGMGFHASVDELKFPASAGENMIQGIAKVGENYHFAVLAAMIIPLFLYVFLHSELMSARFVALFAALLNVIAIIGSHSRGALITLFAVGVLLSVRTKHRFLVITAMALGTVLMSYVVPSSWMSRMATIQTADSDTSSMSRAGAWQASSALSLSVPLTGGSFHAIQSASVWGRFSTDIGSLPFVDAGVVSIIPLAAHSIYFEMMGDIGFIGLFLFIAILVYALRNAH